MSAGKRFKWQGSTIEFGVDFSAESPGLAITGISKANPAHVLATNTLTEGQPVRLVDVVGMTEVNDELFIAVNVSGAGFDLRGVNSTDYATYVSGGVVDVMTMSAMCELTGYNRQGGSSPEIEATSVCSEADEYEIGLPNFGTIALDYNFAPQTGVQLAMQEFQDSGEKTAIRVTLPKSGGIRTAIAFVQQTSEQASNGTLWKGSATMRVTGRPYDQAGA